MNNQFINDITHETTLNNNIQPSKFTQNHIDRIETNI